MSDSPVSLENARSGPTAPAEQFQVVTGGSDTVLSPWARSADVLTAGVVSVVDGKGIERTFTAPAGITIKGWIREVKTATAANLLVYQY